MGKKKRMNQVFCPFCNAPLTSDPSQQAAKVICPRCGESVPAHLIPEMPASVPSGQPPAAPPVTWSNRKIGLSIFAGMLLMALVGLTLALATWEGRRRNDHRGQAVTVPPSSVLAPSDLAGLGYLPVDVNVAAALQVAELQKDDLGKKLLEASRPPLMDLLLTTVEKWTRISIQDVDHIVLGTEIKDKLPQLTVVVRTLKAVNLADLAKALQSGQPTLHRAKPLFHFKLTPGEGMLWCPEPNILVLLFRFDALKSIDLEAIPAQPRKGTNAPPAVLRSLFAQGRIHKHSLAWAAGNLVRPDVLKDWLAVIPLHAGNEQILANIQAFGLSLVAQDGLTVDGYFRGSDENKTRLLQKQLEGLNVKDVKSFKVAGPPANAVNDDAQWISLQVRGDAQAIGRYLGGERSAFCTGLFQASLLARLLTGSRSPQASGKPELWRVPLLMSASYTDH